MALADLVATWTARAESLAPYAAAAAEAFRRAAAELEAELRDRANEGLTLEQASAESGYAVDSLRHMVRDGKLANAGRRGAPLVRRGDLPRRPSLSTSTYNPDDDALSIARRRAK
jgi:hypothetical protein